MTSPDRFFGGKCAALDCGRPIIRTSNRGARPRFCSGACRVADCTGQFRRGTNDAWAVSARRKTWENVVGEFGLDPHDFSAELSGEILNRPLDFPVKDQD